MSEKTRSKIRLAARLKLDGVNKWQASKQLYPELDTERAYNDTKRLYRNFAKEIALEEARQRKRPESR
jgi:hypothetical protein